MVLFEARSSEMEQHPSLLVGKLDFGPSNGLDVATLTVTDLQPRYDHVQRLQQSMEASCEAINSRAQQFRVPKGIGNYSPGGLSVLVHKGVELGKDNSMHLNLGQMNIVCSKSHLEWVLFEPGSFAEHCCLGTEVAKYCCSRAGLAEHCCSRAGLAEHCCLGAELVEDYRSRDELDWPTTTAQELDWPSTTAQELNWTRRALLLGS
ncbi:hypothetical protein GW17_00014654 [Ensete ventricosum]|nr:hypothetical protein GW17_00014654 [Ensete ventricosum]